MNAIPELEYNEKKGHFHITVNNQTEAKMTFVFAGEHKIIINHTKEKPCSNGKGYRKKLVEKAVKKKKKKGITILPLCPFAKSVFDKIPELRDVL